MNALYATAAAPLRADPSEGVRAVLSSTEPTAHICTAGPRNLPTLCWFLATLFAIRLFRWKRFFCHFVQKPKRQQLKPFHFSGLNSRRFIGLLSPRNNRRSSKAQLKMMNNRDRWRVYKRVSVMFFLAVVGLTVVQRGSINMGAPFELGRQARMDASRGAEPGTAPEEKTDLYLGMKGFWKASKYQPVPKAPATTQEPRITEDSSPRTWDVTSSNCSANLNLSSQDWFRSLEESFKQFMLYRHCRYFPMLLNHPEKCTGDTYLLMVIKSVATQHDRREVIRKTWGKEQAVDGKRIKALFLLGKPSNEAERANHQKLVEYENYIYRDILQWDFLDSFFNLTLKETHFLKWFHIYCPSVRYVFKGDDDVFVSVENIFEFLESSNHAKNLFVGDVIFKAKPIRKKENKYYIPQALYDKTHYPPYAGGGGFLMDGTLVRRLHWVADTLELYPIDDVFLGMCLEVLQVTPIKHNAFKTFGLVKNKSSKLNREPCFFKSMIVVHKLLPSDLMHMWNLVNSDLVCSQKVEIL